MFSDLITSFVSPRISIILTAIIYGYLFAVFDQYYVYCLGRPYVYLFIAVVPVVYLGFAS